MGNSPATPWQHQQTVVRRRERFIKDATQDPERKIDVRFSSDYHEFVARTAAKLSHKLKYRSDGGAVARGLVLHSEYPRPSTLWGIHSWLSRQRVQPDRRIWLWYTIWRRRARAPSDRWAIKIVFGLNASSKIFSGTQVPRGTSPKDRAERIIRQAMQLADDIPGDQGKRIRAWLELAKKVGHPKMIELWHYNAHALEEFAWAPVKEQEAMIRRGGGFPLRGKLQGTWQGGPPDWREYPFRGLLYRYFDAPVQQWKLKHMDKLLGDSVAALASAPGGKGAGGEKAVSAPVRRFRAHLKQLAKTPGNLYHESDRNTTDNRSLWERL